MKLPDGASKARFLRGFGFREGDWRVLADSLRRIAVTWDVATVVESSFGTRYTVIGPLESPDGRNPRVRTVWIVDKGSAIPRLITAYPA
jgi:hypothetical protein